MSNYLVFFPYIGGKFFMLKHILRFIPSHKIYVEVFGGSGKVLLNKPKSEIEVWNDYDKRLANLFHVVAFKFDEFYEKVSKLVYSRELFDAYKNEIKGLGSIELGDVDAAVKTYYVLCIAFAGGGLDSSFGTGRSICYPESFFNKVDSLKEIHKRLRNVIVECDDFENIIKRYDTEETWLFIDPPYYGVEDYYSGFKREDHERLLKLLKEVKGKWLLCGYANELYDRELKDYGRFEFTVTKSSYYKEGMQERPKAVEVLWCNYKIERFLGQGHFFVLGSERF